jgi:hypothetical protein
MDGGRYNAGAVIEKCGVIASMQEQLSNVGINPDPHYADFNLL